MIVNLSGLYIIGPIWKFCFITLCDLTHSHFLDQFHGEVPAAAGQLHGLQGRPLRYHPRGCSVQDDVRRTELVAAVQRGDCCEDVACGWHSGTIYK